MYEPSTCRYKLSDRGPQVVDLHLGCHNSLAKGRCRRECQRVIRQIGDCPAMEEAVLLHELRARAQAEFDSVGIPSDELCAQKAAEPLRGQHAAAVLEQ